MKRPGLALRRLREHRGLTLREVSKLTGIPTSSLSRVESGKLNLSFHRLVQISEGLDVDLAEIFEMADERSPGAPAIVGRRSICRAGDPDARRPAADLLQKRLSPQIIDPPPAAGGVPEFTRVEGEIYAYVLSGEAELHTELYAALRLSEGDSIYFDGAMGHAWTAVGAPPCQVLTVTSAAGPTRPSRAGRHREFEE